MSRLPDGLLRVPIAHRALHDADAGRPENSLAALRAAIDAGYPAEIDLQLSSDGQAMVFHDYALDRLTSEKGAIRQRSARELGDILLNNSDETIPTLARVLEEVGGRVPLLIEVKDQDGALGTGVGQLERAVARDLARYDGEAAVMSFNPHSVAALRALAPDLPLGLTTGPLRKESWGLVPEAVRKRLREIPDVKTVDADFISHHANELAHPRVKEIRDSGIPVLCWTIRDDKAEAKAREYADNVTFEGYRAVIPAT